ncbi:hypothetical protein ECANGB1_665 [Enterospora canceri]|uniref:Major facilitator superfamily associated domain-containing protein n=1 Tax=Enterospora canceri TaxID=1081671 RepID=A0A1Y1S7L4_9MICR|nr:hypothetical protein ECANGB1_665 [Enterospora canceri]
MFRIRTKLGNLNRRLLIHPKLLYFATSLFFYTLHMYRSQFVTEMYGVKKSYWGLYFTIPQIASLVFGINAAAFVDRLGIQKWILVGSIGVAMALFGAFFAISSFALFLAIFTIYFSCVSVTIPLIDKVVLEFLDRTDGVEMANYGRQRMFCPIGYIVCCFILDYIVGTSQVGGSVVYDFRPLIPYALVTGAAAIGAVLLLVANLPRQNAAQRSNLRLVGSLLRNSEFTFFILLIFLNGITRASMTNYVNVYYDDHLGFNKDNKNATGLSLYQWIHNGRKKAVAVLFGNITELAVYVLSAPIVCRYGLLLPIFWSQLAQVVRFGGYFLLAADSPIRFEVVLLLEMVKGVGFGLIQSSAATLAVRLVASDMKGTAQLVYNGAFIALGTVAAGVGFLFVFNAYKATGNMIPVAAYKAMFLIDGLLTLLCIGLMLMKYAMKDRVLFDTDRLNEKLDRISAEALEEEMEDVKEIDGQEEEEKVDDLKKVKIAAKEL